MKKGILFSIVLLFVVPASFSFEMIRTDSSTPDILITEAQQDVLEEARRLIARKRYEAAYELLHNARDRYANSQEWCRLMIEVDDYFVRKYGQSRLYPIDRLNYRLILDPTDREARYELADHLTDTGRFYEAEQVLRAQEYINPDDPEFRLRLDAMEASRVGVATRRIQQLERRIVTNPSDAQAYRQLGHFRSVLGDLDASVKSYEKAMQFAPQDSGIRFEYAQMLSSAGRYAEALEEAEYLLSIQPGNADYKNLYSSASLFSGYYDTRTERYIQEALASDPTNIDLIANLALLRIYQGRIDDADRLARQAQTFAGSVYYPRLEQLDDMIAQAKTEATVMQPEVVPLRGAPPPPAVRLQMLPESELHGEVREGNIHTPAQEQLPAVRMERYQEQIAAHYAEPAGQRIIRSSFRCNQILEGARNIYHEGRFFDSADLYEEYFRCSGDVRPELLIEMANAIEAGGDPVSAISVLQAAQQYRYDETIALRMAQTRFDINDYAGSRQVLEYLLQKNPDNVDALVLLGDTYAAEGRNSVASDLYHQAQDLDPNNSRIAERFGWVKQPRGGNGYDYAVLINPLVQGVMATGFGTEYNRLTLGIESQITLPIPVVLTAGFASHGVEGTRFQARPGIRDFKPGFDSPIPRAEEWFNQVALGAFWDITPALPYRIYRENYTNRISLRGGIYDYSGGRTAPFGSVQYLHQSPKRYQFGLGVDVNEGSIALWAPGGAEDKLRLTQYSANFSTDYLFDSRARFDAGFAYNVVEDAFSGFSSRNEGINVFGDLGFRIARETYLGVGYYLLNYDNTTNFYFSPTNYNYQEYTLWAEREYMNSDVSYFRLRATGGVIGPTDFGFVRGHLDWMYRFRYNFAAGVNLQASQAFRYRNRNDQSSNTYTILIGGVSLYWTL